MSLKVVHLQAFGNTIRKQEPADILLSLSANEIPLVTTYLWAVVFMSRSSKIQEAWHRKSCVLKRGTPDHWEEIIKYNSVLPQRDLHVNLYFYLHFRR